MDLRRPKVIVVDDEPGILKTMMICFESIGFDVRSFGKPQDALEAIRSEPFDLAFLDLKMSPIDGMELLAEFKLHQPQTSVTIVTAHGSIDSAIEAVRRGAYYYLQKPFDLKELKLFAQQMWEHHQLSVEVRELRSQVGANQRRGDIITRNHDMLAQVDLAERVALSDISILLEGESGTGKEVLASFIHQKSPRAEKQFVRVNCAAIPEQLLESELFGHVKGAFTGATKDRDGRFEMANGGTVFLDEIAELSPALQAKLLRVLQSKEYERVGENATRTVDVRVIAATNRNVDEALKEGTFREDLFYRLNAVRIKLPPLRERPDDIPLLAQYFLTKFAGESKISLSPETVKLLRAYRWSGNIRELEHVIQRAVVLSHNGVIEPSHLPEEVRSSGEKAASTLSLEEMEKLHIKKVLQNTTDLDQASRMLGIDPATLWRKRKKYGL